MKGAPLDPDSFEVQGGLASGSEDFGNKLPLRESGDAEVYLIRAIRATELMRKQQPDLAEPYFYLAAPYGSLVVIKHGTEKMRLGGRVKQYAKKAIALNPITPLLTLFLGVFSAKWRVSTGSNVPWPAASSGVSQGSATSAVHMSVKARTLPHFSLCSLSTRTHLRRMGPARAGGQGLDPDRRSVSLQQLRSGIESRSPEKAAGP